MSFNPPIVTLLNVQTNRLVIGRYVNKLAFVSIRIWLDGNKLRMVRKFFLSGVDLCKCDYFPPHCMIPPCPLYERLASCCKVKLCNLNFPSIFVAGGHATMSEHLSVIMNSDIFSLNLGEPLREFMQKHKKNQHFNN